MDLTDLDGTTVAGNDELLVPFNPKDVHRVVVAASQDQVSQDPGTEQRIKRIG